MLLFTNGPRHVGLKPTQLPETHQFLSFPFLLRRRAHAQGAGRPRGPLPRHAHPLELPSSTRLPRPAHPSPTHKHSLKRARTLSARLRRSEGLDLFSTGVTSDEERWISSCAHSLRLLESFQSHPAPLMGGSSDTTSGWITPTMC